MKTVWSPLQTQKNVESNYFFRPTTCGRVRRRSAGCVICKPPPRLHQWLHCRLRAECAPSSPQMALTASRCSSRGRILFEASWMLIRNSTTSCSHALILNESYISVHMLTSLPAVLPAFHRCLQALTSSQGDYGSLVKLLKRSVGETKLLCSILRVSCCGSAAVSRRDRLLSAWISIHNTNLHMDLGSSAKGWRKKKS